VNYAPDYQESASAVIAPDDSFLAHQRYGEAGLLVVDINLAKASGKLANRFKPHLYQPKQ